MVNHHHAVARHADVELERVDTDRERALEPRERVLRRMAARAPVTLKIECRRRLRSQCA